MTLGQTITRLRTAKGMSQGALAEELGVSRQSVSKWETDASVPELEKLLKMAKLFGVTLDELVTGEPFTAPETPPPQVVIVEKKREKRKTVGFVFLALSLFCLLSGNIWLQVLAALPCLMVGVICLLTGWHPGLCSLWAVAFFIDCYTRFATGLSWRTVRWTPYWEPSMNYLRLAIAWVLFFNMVLLLLVSIWHLRKETVFPKGLKVLLLVLPLAGVALRVTLPYILSYDYIYRFWTVFIEWPLMALIVAAVKLLRRRTNQKDG